MTRSPASDWPGIELRHLAALAAIAREGSFRGAADSLGYVQSAVSQQLAHLERIVGARLVERRRGASPVSLTEAGELLLHHSEQILARLIAARSDLGAIGDDSRELSIGVFDAIATRVLPRLLRSRSGPLANVRLRTFESRTTAELAEGVIAGDLDIAFGELPLEPGPFEHRELMRDPYVVLVPAGWQVFENAEAPSPEEIAALPLIGSNRARRSAVVDEALRARGVQPRYVFHSDVDAAVQALVGAGIGAAVVPRLSVDESDRRTVMVELTEIVSPRVIALYWQGERRRSATAEAFVSVVAATCAEFGHDEIEPEMSATALAA
jgi:molybdate transport repressor ModE-like protein